MVVPRGLRGGPVAESSRPPAPIPAAAGARHSQPALPEPMAQAERGVASRERPAAPVAPSQLSSPAGAEAGTAGAGGSSPPRPPPCCQSAAGCLRHQHSTRLRPRSRVRAVTIAACPRAQLEAPRLRGGTAPRVGGGGYRTPKPHRDAPAWTFPGGDEWDHRAQGLDLGPAASQSWGESPPAARQLPCVLLPRGASRDWANPEDVPAARDHGAVPGSRSLPG